MSFPSLGENYEPRRLHFTPFVSYGLIALSAIVAALTRLGANDPVVERLLISTYPASGSALRLPEVVGGEVWRLITPIFLHFGAVHLIFNLLWLKDLGAMMERREGPGRLLVFVLATGLLSNFGQLYTNGPFFGGMSGVVYGLLGYVWMRARFSPGTGYGISSQSILIMLGWFVACVLGFIPNVANTAHGVGLGLGIIWGFLQARGRRLSRISL